MAESGIHRCKSGHFHIFEPGITPTWPFWSAKEAFGQVNFLLNLRLISLTEATRLRKEIERLTRVQPRKSGGHFDKRLLPLQPRHGVDGAALVKDWVEFFNGGISDIELVDHKPYMKGRPVPMLGPVTVSLLCDFIRREGKYAEPLRSLERT